MRSSCSFWTGWNWICGKIQTLYRCFSQRVLSSLYLNVEEVIERDARLIRKHILSWLQCMSIPVVLRRGSVASHTWTLSIDRVLMICIWPVLCSNVCIWNDRSPRWHTFCFRECRKTHFLLNFHLAPSAFTRDSFVEIQTLEHAELSGVFVSWIYLDILSVKTFI